MPLPIEAHCETTTEETHLRAPAASTLFYLGSFGMNPSTPSTQEEILAGYSAGDKILIEELQELLAALAHFVSKDFGVKIELNIPGQGWHWDFGSNIIRIDPNDLLTKPLPFLRFVIAHEAGHRRISRFHMIPDELWNAPGYSFMTNSLEDPRTNNFIADAYAIFGVYMQLVYKASVESEQRSRSIARDKLGYEPDFIKAGFEYIRQWFIERVGFSQQEPGEGLSEQVKEVLSKTLSAASESWNHYPSKEESELGEGNINRYANRAFEINRDKIWPEFKRLIEHDLKDQRVQELLKELSRDLKSNCDGKVPKPLGDKLSEEELQALEELLKNSSDSATSNGRASKAVPLDALSPEIRAKLEEYFNNLPKLVREQLQKRAEESLREFEREVNAEVDETLERASQDMALETQEEQAANDVGQENVLKERRTNQQSPIQATTAERVDLRNIRKYKWAKGLMGETIRKLESSLRSIFRERRHDRERAEHHSGRNISIRKRANEVGKGVSVAETRAWKRKEAPLERDYAITILVDLTGSMVGDKIKETLKGLVAILEPLDKLSIKTEVLGFNSLLFEYKRFNQPLSDEIRAGIGSMEEVIQTRAASNTDDGWALSKASERLRQIKAKKKFMIILTDGASNPSLPHAGSEYELSHVIAAIRAKSNQIVIALGLGPGTAFVSQEYPNSVANISARELSRHLAGLLREIVLAGDTFRK